MVEDEQGLWLAKFGRTDDRWNNARVERTMLTLSWCCGISIEESKIVIVAGRNVLLVKRFDRERGMSGYRRTRMASALTLFRTEDTHQSRDRWSYVALAEELRRISATPKKDAEELFRRMVFNALISNTDDHPRNHAVLAPAEKWKLSPVYDLTPTNPISLARRDLTMICGDGGRHANATNLLSQSGRFLLAPQKAEKIVRDMAVTVEKNWYGVARSEGVVEADCERIKGAFVYPGFWQKNG